MDIKQRIEWIDIAKGIGMILVIAGHCFQLDRCHPIYSFHMPLFFFLSGILISNPNKIGIVAFIEKKSKQILFPWILMLSVSFAVCLVIPSWRDQMTLKRILMDLYSSNTNIFQNSSLWYLPCFFLTLLLFYVFNLARIKRGQHVVIVFIIAIFGLVIKDLMSFIPLPDFRLPFKLDSAIVALPFLAIASMYRVKFFVLINSLSKVPVMLILIILTVFFSNFNGWVNINSLEFGNFRALYYPIAFIGILTTCIVSNFISIAKRKRIIKFLSFYGRNSLIIFGFQSLFIRLYLLIINRIYGANLVLYGENPIIHQLGSFLIVTLGCMPLTVLVYKKILEYRKNE